MVDAKVKNRRVGNFKSGTWESLRIPNIPTPGCPFQTDTTLDSCFEILSDVYYPTQSINLLEFDPEIGYLCTVTFALFTCSAPF
ncbi:hypothetical protein STEG23_024782 [Scotinomys teguina]